MPPIVKADLADQDLKKHVAAIHIENRLSLLERKMANVLLFNAYPKLLEQETHRIRIKDLAAILGFDSNDRDCLKKALVNLMSTVLTWNIIDRQGNEKVWRARPMLMSADIDRHWCIYAYHHDLRQKLFNPEIYSRINLSIQRQFTSGYALSLYENCLRYLGTGSTGWWPLDLFRKLMGVEENDYYTDFRRLNSKVIKPAVEQVNKTSDIFLEAETKSEKRRVVSIRFFIKENPQMPLITDRRSPLNAAAQAEVVESSERVRAHLREFGVSEKDAVRLLQQHDGVYIEENLAIVAEMRAKGTIKTTPRAAVLHALRTDYRSHSSHPQNDLPLVEGEASLACPAENSPDERQEQLYREFEKQRLETAFDSLSAQDRDRLEADFASEMSQGSTSSYAALRPIYHKHGLAHAAVQGCFRHFARHRLLTDASHEEFEAFLRARRDA